MSEPLVIKYLLEHTFNELEEEHGVKARPASEGMCSKFSLNYDQIKVKPGDKLAEQCRGMVVKLCDEQQLSDLWKDEIPGHLEVLAWPMNRFYNSGETTAAKIDWSTAKVLEKLDGTMIVLYADRAECEWCVATRSVPNADLPMNSDGIVNADRTFSTLFKEGVQNTLGISFDEWTSKLDSSYTYVFELTSPYNRVVVKYDDTRITLLAVRDTKTSLELDPVEFCELLKRQKIEVPPLPKTFDLSSIEGAAAYVDQQDPAQMEGVVIIDEYFNRVKVKNSKWVLSSKMHDAITTSRRSVLEAILAQKIDDVIPLLEGDIRTEVEALTHRVHRYIQNLDKSFAKWRSLAGDDRKEFAKLVMTEDCWKAPYFMLFEKRFEDAATCLKSLVDGGRISRDSMDFILTLADRI